MADIFDEVEEGLRQERYQRLLRRWGPLGLAAVLAVILGVAGREAWTASQARAAARSSEAFASAQSSLEAGDFNIAMAEFAALAEEGSRGYAALAKMQEAAAAAALGSYEEAAELYEAAAARTNDPLVAGMARLKGAYLIADRVELAELEERLEPLRERGAPYEVAASELLGAAALREGDYVKAREAYTYLTVSLEAPGGVRSRAEEALAVIDAATAAAASPSTEEG